MNLLPRIPLWAKIGGGAVLALGLSGALAAWLGPHEPHVKTTTTTHTKTERKTDEATQRKLDERQRIIDELTTKLQERSEHQANVNTRVVERIERYAPAASSPAPSGAPVQPGSLIPIAVPTPIEVVTRTTETTDTSHDTKDSTGESTRKTDTTGEKHETTDTHKTETAKSDTAKSDTATTTTTEKGGGGSSGHSGIFTTDDGTSRLGIGGAFGQKGGAGIAVTYDLYNKPIFPKLPVVNKIRAGLGLFGEVPVGAGGDVVDFKRADFGPQLNVGTKHVFLFGGYRVRQKDPVVGVGMRIRF